MTQLRSSVSDRQLLVLTNTLRFAEINMSVHSVDDNSNYECNLAGFTMISTKTEQCYIMQVC